MRRSAVRVVSSAASASSSSTVLPSWAAAGGAAAAKGSPSSGVRAVAAVQVVAAQQQKRDFRTRGKLPTHEGRIRLIPKPNSMAILPPEKLVTEDAATGWKRFHSKRTGLLAVKVGMTQVSDEWGRMWPLTILYIPDDQYVVQTFTEERDGFNAVQVGAIQRRLNTTPRTQWGHFAKAGLPPLTHMAQFRVSKEGLVAPGTQLDIRHFVVGQKVTVQGTTVGKGFQGVMKRWGFSGGRATHGTSRAHRTAGATGMCQDPGKVQKGKKMPGHMGAVSCTVRNLDIYEMDLGERTIGVVGAVPGYAGGIVRVVDSLSEKWMKAPPPFPTFARASTELEYPSDIITRPNPKPWVADLEEDSLPPLGTSERRELDFVRQDEAKRARIPKSVAKIWGVESDS